MLHHLLLSQTAFRRDIDDPKTILDLAETIQSPERLRLLLVLTVADMRAVSSKVWNGWKATLLRELYTRVAEVLAGGLATTERDVRVREAREQAAALLDDFSAADLARFEQLGYGGYWLGFDPDTHARHARMIREAEATHAPLTVQAQPLPARAVTEVTVYAADHAGLFSRIAGRARRRRCLDRRRTHSHTDERHGARHVLGAGRGRRHVRRAVETGAIADAGRAGGVRQHRLWPPRSAARRTRCSAAACARSTCRRAW